MPKITPLAAAYTISGRPCESAEPKTGADIAIVSQPSTLYPMTFNFMDSLLYCAPWMMF
jgi:hypothetical protein